MTDLSKVIAEANAISTSSSRIRLFAQDVAAILIDLDKRLTAAEAKAAPSPTPTPVPTPTPAPTPSGLPKQGFSNSWAILGRTSADQDRELDACKDLANGKPWWLRLDWWPGDARWDVVATKARARGATMMGLYNAVYTGRPSQAAYAANCGTLATKCDLVNTTNEPDMNGWPPAEIAEYLVASYAAVHSANPHALVIGPSIWKTPADTPEAAQAYVAAMLAQANGRPMWDVFDIHMYGDPRDIGPWNVWAKVFTTAPTIKSLLKAGTPIICTEAGDSAAADGETAQLNAIVGGMDARTTLGLAGFGVFSVPDDSSPGGFGLKRTDWTARPAYAAFKARAA